MAKSFTFHILVGLPASGKSYYAYANYHENSRYGRYSNFVIHLDNYAGSENPLLAAFNDPQIAFEEIYVNRPSTFSGFYDVNVCLDGLITTVEQVKTVMTTCIDYLRSKYFDNDQLVIQFVIHKWSKDIDACLYNDANRVSNGERHMSSETSIKNIPYEYDDITPEAFNDIDADNISMVLHNVVKVSAACMIINSFINNDSYTNDDNNGAVPIKTKYMYSEEWSGGGSWGDCWGNSGTVSADEPNDFPEFDDLLTKLCPAITFLQYKKLKSTCVDVIENIEYDYYGGSVTNLRWRCDTEKLYNTLKEMNLVK